MYIIHFITALTGQCTEALSNICQRPKATKNHPYAQVGLATLNQGCKLHILGFGGPCYRGELSRLRSYGLRGIIVCFPNVFSKQAFDCFKFLTNQRYLTGEFSVA